MVDHQRDSVCQIEAWFVDKGWRLRVQEKDKGTWTALFCLGPIAGETMSARNPTQVSGATRVAAAEAAWAIYEREPWLGGTFAPAEDATKNDAGMHGHEVRG
jgi:hypothetical protein